MFVIDGESDTNEGFIGVWRGAAPLGGALLIRTMDTLWDISDDQIESPLSSVRRIPTRRIARKKIVRVSSDMTRHLHDKSLVKDLAYHAFQDHPTFGTLIRNQGEHVRASAYVDAAQSVRLGSLDVDVVVALDADVLAPNIDDQEVLFDLPEFDPSSLIPISAFA